MSSLRKAQQLVSIIIIFCRGRRQRLFYSISYAAGELIRWVEKERDLEWPADVLLSPSYAPSRRKTIQYPITLLDFFLFSTLLSFFHSLPNALPPYTRSLLLFLLLLCFLLLLFVFIILIFNLLYLILPSSLVRFKLLRENS